MGSADIQYHRSGHSSSSAVSWSSSLPPEVQRRAFMVYFARCHGAAMKNSSGVVREESRHRERRAVVKLPRAREKEREEDTICSVVRIIFSRDVISEIHTRDTQVSYVTAATFIGWIDLAAPPVMCMQMQFQLTRHQCCDCCIIWHVFFLSLLCA